MAVIKDFITRSGIIVQGTSAVTSSSGQTGALQVNSGAAINKNLVVGGSGQIYGSVNLYNQLTVSGATTINGILTASTTANLQHNVTIGGTLGVSGQATLNALTVTNASVFNGTILANGATTFNAPVFITGTNTLSVGTGTASFGGVVSITDTTAATSGGAGALKLSGGAYIAKNLIVLSTDANTQTNTSNALYVAGGAWVGNSLVVAGDTTFRGNVVFNGTQTSVYSTVTVYTDSLLNLHVPKGTSGEPTTSTWNVDDGDDIGFIFNYYKGQDKDAFLGWSNSSGFLEWFEDGLEVNGNFTGTTYGVFRTGGIRLTNTQTAISSSTGALQVNGGIGAVNIYANNNISGGSLTARGLTQGRLVYVGAGGLLTDSGSLTTDGTTITGTITSANNATNLVGGAIGSLPYQTATNQTVFLPIGNAGEILVVSGGKPAWTAPTGLSAGQANTSTNLAGGTAGQVPYQTSAGNTSFFGPGNAGQILTSNGTSGPAYVNTGNVFVGYANFSVNVNGGAQGQIPIQSGANTTGFIPAGATNTFLRHDGTTATFVTTGSMFVGNAVTSTNLRDGTAGQVVYQSSTSTTAFTGPGNAGEILVSRGTSGPVYQNTLTLAGTSNSTSTNTGALQVLGGVGVAQSIYVGSNSTVAGISTILDTTQSTSTSTGALQVRGGATVARNLWIGGIISIDNTASSTNTTTGALQVLNGGVGIGGNINVGGTANIAGVTSLTNTTNATNSTTGALVVSGGVGVSQNLFVYGNTNVVGITTVENTTNASSTNTGALQVRGGAGIGRDLYVGGTIFGTLSGTATNATNVTITNDTSTTTTHYLTFVSGTTGNLPVKVDGNDLVFVPSTGFLGLGTTTPTTRLDVAGGTRISGVTTVTNTSQATSTVTGALQIAGGVGIQQNLYVGGTTNLTGVETISNTTNASSTTTGALVVSGGAGIGQNLFVGGNLNVSGSISGTLAGNATTVSTVQQNANASHFVTFVDSNNSSAGAENIYTTSSFTINPSNGNVNISGSLTIGSAGSGATVNALYSNNILLSSYTTPVLTTASSVTLDSLSTSSYRTARYTAQVVRGTSVHITEVVLFHNGVDAYLNEYGISTTDGELGVFDASITTGNMVFTFTPASTASTVVKVVRMALTS